MFNPGPSPDARLCLASLRLLIAFLYCFTHDVYPVFNLGLVSVFTSCWILFKAPDALFSAEPRVIFASVLRSAPEVFGLDFMKFEQKVGFFAFWQIAFMSATFAFKEPIITKNIREDTKTLFIR